MAFEDASFLFLGKLRCHFINPVGDDIFAPMKQPLGCAFQNIFGNGIYALVYKPLDLGVWPKSRNGKKVIVPTLSSCPFCKKTSGRWDEFLKPRY